ncbi:AEC family transporter [Aliarcobacter skirrowii]|uniref:AEC family transporter n=1 Tax=Aliarcobacter skirrowii TaxID=28200 RepID=A0AAW9D7M7_9BACT|nr:AEC family transporter [Aliarcobacter skirrowii]MDD2507506.1 AEC family transporter [Aliarcobacter skirrowii]MDD3495858.1 AEC family transporter [Aliarcobacter skirrowii]MDX4026905.1 AEC family transporter [Aliarcobacter skirrowii]MDX4058978.1 AEC family transporter [Aliarcobacter skirrowii]MDX4068206.1 AEC family transporter [Aliarcobacter skirrowii]
MFSVLPIYFFILLGFFAKKRLQTQIDEKSLVLLSLYFLQPIMIFWGLTKEPINYEFVLSPLFFLLSMLISLSFMLMYSKFLFSSKTDENIFLATALIGNTGNLGIPLGIALFGVESVPYTSIINIANIFFMYTISIYFFARDKFNFKDSVKSIFKIPVIWFAIFALAFNYFEFKIPKEFDFALEMGAYTSLTLQLIIFGTYLYSVKVKTIPWRLSLQISFAKHILLPVVGIVVIVGFTNLNSMIASILIMELMMPLAVNNVNFSVVYNTKPSEVAATILVSSAIFVGILHFYIEIIEYFI